VGATIFPPPLAPAGFPAFVATAGPGVSRAAVASFRAGAVPAGAFGRELETTAPRATGDGAAPLRTFGCTPRAFAGSATPPGGPARPVGAARFDAVREGMD
jgi:hypothetical protein